MKADDLRRLARRTGFDVVQLEKDYALSWILYGYYAPGAPLTEYLVFKGGTAIRKVFFPEWRLSEGLDFSVTTNVTASQVRSDLQAAFSLVRESGGMDLEFKTFHSSHQGILADVQYLGPFGRKNRVSHDISMKEILIEPPLKMEIARAYEDIPIHSVTVYSLNEILVEKLRSMMQRLKGRDYYDTWRLLREHDFPKDRIHLLLGEKCHKTGVDYRPERIFDEERLAEIEDYWTRALGRLTRDLPPFSLVLDDLRVELAFLLGEKV